MLGARRLEGKRTFAREAGLDSLAWQHYGPSITRSLLIHFLTLRHAQTRAGRRAHANADTP